MQHQKTPNNVWYLWLDQPGSPWENMAKDEILLQNLKSGNSPLLRFYSWDKPAVSIGCFQNHSEVKPVNAHFVRRPTGGGIVWHGADITYTLVCPSSYWLYDMSRCDSYRIVHSAIISGLQIIDINGKLSDKEIQKAANPSQMQCFDEPTQNDIIFGNGKIAGAAQKRNSFGMLHQGSVQLLDKSQFDRDKIVSSIIDGFKNKFDFSTKIYRPSSFFYDQVNELVKSKYSTAEWNEKR